MNYALELCNLTRRFDIRKSPWQKPKPLTAVDQVSLRIKPGEVLGLVGESGCGKSTLSKMILGLLTPCDGNILLNGREMDLENRLSLAKHIQPIFQDPYSSLNPRKKIFDIIQLPLKLHKIGLPAEQQNSVRDIAKKVGLPEHLLEQYPGQLSGGQRQRVAIARALILQPQILICDEPTSALDVSVQAQILNLLLELKNELGLTYLFISHNLAVVEHLANNVAVMYQGKIVEQGECKTIFHHPKHQYTKALLSSILTPDTTLGLPTPQDLNWQIAH